MVVTAVLLRAALVFGVLAYSGAASAQSLPKPKVQTQQVDDNSDFAASTAYVDRSMRSLSDAVSGKAPLASPTFSGSVTAPSLAITGTGSTGDASAFSVKPMEGGVARSLTDLFSNQLYAVNFGVTFGAADNGPAMRTALARAQQLGARLWLPPWAINVCADPNDADALLRIERYMDLVGQGRNSKIIPCADAGTRAVLMVKPLANAGGIRGMLLSSFQIGDLNAAQRNGGDGLRLQTTNNFGFIAKLTVENISVSQSVAGIYAVHHINDPSPTTGNRTGGVFGSTFRDSDFFGGMKFEQTGDSNNIERNIIAGPNVGIDYQAIDGAATHRIAGNNITSTGGAIIARNMQQIKIYENQLEQFYTYTGPLATPAVIAIDNVSDWVVRDNNINAYDKADVVLAQNNARYGRLGPNSVSFAADKYLFRAVSSPYNTVERQHYQVVGGNSTIIDRSPTLVDAASPTLGVWQQLALLNNWVASTEAGVRQGLWWMPMPDGTIRLAGAIQGGSVATGAQIATLPARFRSPFTQRLPVLSYTGTNPWQMGTIVTYSTGGIHVQSVPGNNTLSFDGTTFSLRQ